MHKNDAVNTGYTFHTCGTWSLLFTIPPLNFQKQCFPECICTYLVKIGGLFLYGDGRDLIEHVPNSWFPGDLPCWQCRALHLVQQDAAVPRFARPPPWWLPATGDRPTRHSVHSHRPTRNRCCSACTSLVYKLSSACLFTGKIKSNPVFVAN